MPKTIFSMCEFWGLNYSPARYVSYFFNTQTTGTAYLSKSINKIKKKRHIQRGKESYQNLKRNVVPERIQDTAL